MLDTLKNLHPIIATVVSYAEFAVLERTDKCIAVAAIAILAKQCFNEIRDAWNKEVIKLAAKEHVAAKPKVEAVYRDVPDGDEKNLDGTQKMKRLLVTAEIEETLEIIAVPAVKKTWAEINKTNLFWETVKPLAGMTLSLAALAVVVLK